MRKASLGLVIVAVLQFIPIIIMPLGTLQSMSPAIWAAILALFGLLGLALLRRREWARTASIFVQGFNIIVRLLMLTSNAVRVEDAGNVFNTPLVISFVLSMALSAFVLYFIDQPGIQLQMQG